MVSIRSPRGWLSLLRIRVVASSFQESTFMKTAPISRYESRRPPLGHPSSREMSRMMLEHFDVYGFRFSISSSTAEPLEGLKEDFAFFQTNRAEEGVKLELFDEEPPRQDLPSTDACVYTPRNVVYRSDGKRYIDYHGRALGIQDETNGNLKLYSRDPNLLYEAAY